MAEAADSDDMEGDGRAWVRMPYRVHGPVRTILSRLALAVFLIVLAACVVYIGRAGYRDSTGKPVGWLTSFYYAVVTLTTIGYGDVVPVSGGARLVNTLVITPLRLAFLLVLVGTTFRALTERTRREWREQSWRRSVHDHTVVIGYGTTGRAAVSTLRLRGKRPRRIVVIDTDPAAVGDANRHGLVGIVGDGTNSGVLERAELVKAKHVVIATDRDDTAVLAALTARRMNPSAVITASVARAENVALLRGGGADNVITSSETAGHLLGVAALSPAVGTVLEDLLSVGFGLEVAERAPHATEVGRGTEHVREPLLAVVRDGRPMRYCDPQIGGIRAHDRLIVAREARAEDVPARSRQPAG